MIVSGFTARLSSLQIRNITSILNCWPFPRLVFPRRTGCSTSISQGLGPPCSKCCIPACRLIATRSPHDVPDLMFTVGAQVFSETLPVKACETSPEVSPDPVFGWLNFSSADTAGVRFWLSLHGEFSIAKALLLSRQSDRLPRGPHSVGQPTQWRTLF